MSNGGRRLHSHVSADVISTRYMYSFHDVREFFFAWLAILPTLIQISNRFYVFEPTDVRRSFLEGEEKRLGFYFDCIPFRRNFPFEIEGACKHC